VWYLAKKSGHVDIPHGASERLRALRHRWIIASNQLLYPPSSLGRRKSEWYAENTITVKR